MKTAIKTIMIISIIIMLLIILYFIFSPYKIIEKLKNDNSLRLENGLVSLSVSVKKTNNDNYNCLITFTSNDPNDRIKKIENYDNDNVINASNNSGKESISFDYNISKNDLNKRFKITTKMGNITELNTALNVHYNLNGGSGNIADEYWLKGSNYTITNSKPTRSGYTFLGWTSNSSNLDIVQYYSGGTISYSNSIGEEYTLYAVYVKTNSGLIGAVEQITTSGVTTAYVNDKTYKLDVINVNGDLTLNGSNSVTGATLSNNIYEFGNANTDVATQNAEAKNMVVLKVNGNLTINSGVTLTACKSANGYGGPKGLFVYVSGTLTNNGEITMTARGAKATGEDVYLWKNTNNTYEYVPATGATGGNSIYINTKDTVTNGNNGNNGTGRQTGGGGTGSGRNWVRAIQIGSGGTGSSYSGGSGSGAANCDGGGVTAGTVVTSEPGSSIGGAGSNGVVVTRNESGYGQASLGGTGNPSGGYATALTNVTNYVQRNGTGGLLIIYASTFNNRATISSNGVSASTGNKTATFARVDFGGASGGGSINIFYRSLTSRGTLTATGAAIIENSQGCIGGKGGNGTVSIGSVASGSYVAY